MSDETKSLKGLLGEHYRLSAMDPWTDRDRDKLGLIESEILGRFEALTAERDAARAQVEGLRAERDHHRQANEALRERNAELEDALRNLAEECRDQEADLPYYVLRNADAALSGGDNSTTCDGTKEA